MKVRFMSQNKTYTTLRNLSFAPSIDITSMSLPINGFTVDIETEDTINTNQFARLLDDRNNVWAHYWVTKVDRKASRLVTVQAQSPTVWLDRARMPAKYLSGANLGGEIDYCFDHVSSRVGPIGSYCVIESDVANLPVYGWLPEQSPRERLQSLMMSAGCYIKTWHDTEMRVLFAPRLIDVSDAGYGRILQPSEVFWRPTWTNEAPPSHLTLKYYSVTNYETADSQTVQDDYGNTYWVKEGQFGASSTGAAEEIEVGGNMVVRYEDAQALWPKYQSLYFFNEDRAEVDVINNGEIWPGDLITFPLEESGTYLVRGYVSTVDFKFGNQARSTLRLDHCSRFIAAKLILNLTYNGETVHSMEFLFPNTYGYSIDLPDQQVISNGHLRVYGNIAPIEGTTGGAGTTTTVTVACDLISDKNLITGETITDFTPDHIAVTTLPNQISYIDGETITYSGIVVKVYNASGQLLDTPDRPGGVIAFRDLEFTVTTADIDTQSLDIPVAWTFETEVEGITQEITLTATFGITVWDVQPHGDNYMLVVRGDLVSVDGTTLNIRDRRVRVENRTLMIGE